MSTETRKDAYTRVTEHIISDLEQGIRTWMKPWSVAHTAGRITKPRRHNGNIKGRACETICCVIPRRRGMSKLKPVLTLQRGRPSIRERRG